MLLTRKHYRASEDTRRFNVRQPRREQINGLRSLNYGRWSELADLSCAVKNGDEVIPGRTRDESMEMVEETLEWHREMKARTWPEPEAEPVGPIILHLLFCAVPLFLPLALMAVLVGSVYVICHVAS